MSLATQLLWALDRVFPINPAARMTTAEQAAHEVTKVRAAGENLCNCAMGRPPFQEPRFEPLAVKNLRAMAAIPLVRDLFIFGIDAHLRKPLA